MTHSEAVTPSGTHHSVVSGLITHLEAVQVTATLMPSVPVPVLRTVTCPDAVKVTETHHLGLPSPIPGLVTYLGFVLLHAILHQMAAVMVSGNVIPRNQNVFGMCHLPITMCLLNRIISTNLQLIHRLVLHILTALWRLGRQRHMQEVSIWGLLLSRLAVAFFFYSFLPALFMFLFASARPLFQSSYSLE